MTEARVQAHHALQVPAVVGHSLVDAEPDDSHTSFTWSSSADALVGRSTRNGLRAGLRVRDLSVLILGEDDEVLASIALIGRRRSDGERRLARALTELGGGPLERTHFRASYDLPDHPVRDGAALAAHPRYPELADWFSVADGVLSAIASQEAQASVVRCWPHHFDIATLIAFPEDAETPDADTRRSVGVGMTPGDGSIGEPYWYVTPWPPPNGRDLPPLGGGGRWVTEGWIGAVLPGSEMTAASRAAQLGQVTAFLQSAIRACRSLLRG